MQGTVQLWYPRTRVSVCVCTYDTETNQLLQTFSKSILYNLYNEYAHLHRHLCISFARSLKSSHCARIYFKISFLNYYSTIKYFDPIKSGLVWKRPVYFLRREKLLRLLINQIRHDYCFRYSLWKAFSSDVIRVMST